MSEPVRVTQFEFNEHVYSRELNSYKKDEIAIEEKEYNDAIIAYRESEKDKLNDERDAMLNILYASGESYKYQLPTLYNEIMNQMNTYSPKHKRTYVKDTDGNYTSCQDIFYFDDVIVPMNIFAFLRKEYPYFMNYIDSFVLRNEKDVILIDFMSLNV